MLISLKVWGQQPKKTPKDLVHNHLTARYHYGLVIPHYGLRAKMMYLIEDFAQGVEINYGRMHYGKDNWEQNFNHPEIGVGLFYGTFGNKDVYGDGIALFHYVNYKIIQTSRFSTQAKVSSGLGLVTKPFKLDRNNYNMALGSIVNIYIGLGFLFDYRISERLSLAASGTINHISNGSVKNPNRGINLTTLSLGTKYHFNKQSYPRAIKRKLEKSSRREVIILGNMGLAQEPNIDSKFRMCGSVILKHLWHRNKKYAWGAGLDLLYYGGAPYTFLEDQVNANLKFADFYYTGAFVSYDIFMGRSTLYLNLGTYITYKTKPDQRIYPRVGLRYNITDKLMVNYSLKAGFLKAEFLEFGFGYRFTYKKGGKS